MGPQKKQRIRELSICEVPAVPPANQETDTKYVYLGAKQEQKHGQVPASITGV